MAQISLEICGEIFLHLPAVSLIRFRAVCKSWRAVIDDPCFAKVHTNKQLPSNNTILIHNSNRPNFYYLDFETLYFTNGLQAIDATPVHFTCTGYSLLVNFTVTSGHGLMLIINPEDAKTWMIWNPLTHERLDLPKPDFGSNSVCIGHGYDSATYDYKIVVIVLKSGGGRASVYQTHVYSLKSDAWRRISDCPSNSYNHGVFLNGALHWISRPDMIVALDLGSENYHQLKGPPKQFRRFSRWGRLDVLGGCLTMSGYDDKSKNFDLWVMKDYGAHDSWMKLFCIKESRIDVARCSLRPVAYMKNKTQILLNDKLGIFLFDVESNSVKNVTIHGFSGNISAQGFHGSLFRLRDNCSVISGDITTGGRIRELKREMAMADTKLTFCVRNWGGRCRENMSELSIILECG